MSKKYTKKDIQIFREKLLNINVLNKSKKVFDLLSTLKLELEKSSKNKKDKYFIIASNCNDIITNEINGEIQITGESIFKLIDSIQSLESKDVSLKIMELCYEINEVIISLH